MQKLKTKEFWLSLFMCGLGILGIALMVKYAVDWGGWGPVWETDPNMMYISNDIAGRGCSFLMFTNITLYIFCFYTILNFISVLFDIKKLKNFLKNPYVLLFIAVNQFLVLLVFTIMAAVFGMDLSSEVLKEPFNRHNIAASFFKHYVLTIAAIVFAFVQKPRKKVSFKKCLWFLAYPIAYAIVVKICGNVCFPYEWYPYPFFGPKHLWYNLFHNFDNYNHAYAILMVIGCIVAIAGLYVLITYLMCLVYNKIVKRGEQKEKLKPKEENQTQITKA